MNLYLIRHGQTDYNLKGIVQGSGVNTSLNDTGRQQAEMFYQKYNHIPFDVVFTSKLNRSIESVQKFIDKPLPWTALEALNEISWGNTDGTQVSILEHQDYQNTIELWSQGILDIGMEGGETPSQVFEKQKEALKLLNEMPDRQNVLICMHGRAMRIFLCLLTGEPLKNMDYFPHSNLCLYHLQRVNGKYEILLRNDTSHLE